MVGSFGESIFEEFRVDRKVCTAADNGFRSSEEVIVHVIVVVVGLSMDR